MTTVARAGRDGLVRCPWVGDEADHQAYHDHEWGRPVVDEQRLFEKLVLEGFQAGLSWLTILRKREAFRAAFRAFDPERVAAFTDDDVAVLLGDPGIVRNRRKVEAAVRNARALVALHESEDTLAALVWRHAPPPRPRPTRTDEVPATTAASGALARELRARGFAFVGPTTCYAFMQALGLVDDHLAGCHVPPSCCGPAALPAAG